MQQVKIPVWWRIQGSIHSKEDGGSSRIKRRKEIYCTPQCSVGVVLSLPTAISGYNRNYFVVKDPRPTPPWACLTRSMSSGTPTDTAQGDTVGRIVGIRDSWCHPPPQKGAY